MEWINVNKRLPEEHSNVLVTINYSDDVHIAYIKKGKWFIWIDEELITRGDSWIDNVVDNRFGVVAWMELPKRAEWES